MFDDWRTAFGAYNTGSTITTFIAYVLERKIARNPERFGHGAIEGVASPEASSHAKTQVDFIPTMCLGIPGDAVIALLLGALMIQGIAPGPQLITEHPDLFWGLIASFWFGNILLMILNMPLIGIWVKLLQVPYRYLFPSALFFIAVGVFSTSNSLFQVIEVLVFGIVGAIFLRCACRLRRSCWALFSAQWSRRISGARYNFRTAISVFS